MIGHANVDGALDAIRKVRESLDPDDWCGDESMIAALERAEAYLNVPDTVGGGDE